MKNIKLYNIFLLFIYIYTYSCISKEIIIVKIY